MENSRARILIFTITTAFIFTSCGTYQKHEVQKQALVSTEKVIVPKNVKPFEGKFDPKLEKSLLPAISFLKKNFSDSNLLAFEDFSNQWLQFCYSSITDTNLSDGDQCDSYAKAHPKFHLKSDAIDDVCSLGFEPAFFVNSFSSIANPATVAYLKLRDKQHIAGYNFELKKEVAVSAENWILDFGDVKVFREKIEDAYAFTMNILFNGVGDGFMPMTDFNDNLYPDIKKIYEKLANDRNKYPTGKIAKEVLLALAKNNGKMTPEVHQVIDKLVEFEQIKLQIKGLNINH